MILAGFGKKGRSNKINDKLRHGIIGAIGVIDRTDAVMQEYLFQGCCVLPGLQLKSVLFSTRIALKRE